MSECQVPVLSLGLSNIAHTVSPINNSLFKSLKNYKKSTFNKLSTFFDERPSSTRQLISKINQIIN